MENEFLKRLIMHTECGKDVEELEVSQVLVGMENGSITLEKFGRFLKSLM
jgi:hypothetical protein